MLKKRFNALLDRLRKLHGGAMAACAAVMMLVAVAGCQNGVLTISTTDLDKNAQALSYLVKTVVSDTAISSHLSDADKTKLTAIETEVTSITSQIAANSNGSVSVDVSKQWASKLITEVQTFVSIAEPIVATYDPKAASYLTLANQLLPFVQAIADMVTSTSTTTATTSTVTAGAVMALSPTQESQIRASIYKGF